MFDIRPLNPYQYQKKIPINSFYISPIFFDNIWRIQNQSIFSRSHPWLKRSSSKYQYGISRAPSSLDNPQVSHVFQVNATSSKIKIHFDVTVRNFFSIVAAVCRNDLVDVTFAHTSLMPHTDPLIREVNVTLLALKFAAHLNLSFVLFEGNSKPMRTRMDGFMSITSSSSRVETDH